MVRRVVARKLAEDETTHTMLRFKKWESVLANACKLIETTNIMASELEHTIISSMLPSIHIVVLTRFEDDTLADMG